MAAEEQSDIPTLEGSEREQRLKQQLRDAIAATPVPRQTTHFLTKFDNQSEKTLLSPLFSASSESATHERCLLVSKKHSGSLLMAPPFYSKNATANQFSRLGAVTMRNYMCAVWGDDLSRPLAFTRWWVHAEAVGLCYSFELVVPRALGDHGATPLASYLVLTTVARTKPGVEGQPLGFLSPAEVLSLATTWRLPLNEVWYFPCARAPAVEKALHEARWSLKDSQVDALLDPHLDLGHGHGGGGGSQSGQGGGGGGIKQGFLTHLETQGEVLEGFVLMALEVASMQGLHELVRKYNAEMAPHHAAALASALEWGGQCKGSVMAAVRDNKDDKDGKSVLLESTPPPTTNTTMATTVIEKQDPLVMGGDSGGDSGGGSENVGTGEDEDVTSIPNGGVCVVVSGSGGGVAAATATTTTTTTTVQAPEPNRLAIPSDDLWELVCCASGEVGGLFRRLRDSYRHRVVLKAYEYVPIANLVAPPPPPPTTAATEATTATTTRAATQDGAGGSPAAAAAAAAVGANGDEASGGVQFSGACHKCKARGHKAQDCPTKAKGTAAPPAAVTTAVVYQVQVEIHDDNVFYSWPLHAKAGGCAPLYRGMVVQFDGGGGGSGADGVGSGGGGGGGGQQRLRRSKRVRQSSGGGGACDGGKGGGTHASSSSSSVSANNAATVTATAPPEPATATAMTTTATVGTAGTATLEVKILGIAKLKCLNYLWRTFGVRNQLPTLLDQGASAFVSRCRSGFLRNWSVPEEHKEPMLSLLGGWASFVTGSSGGGGGGGGKGGKGSGGGGKGSKGGGVGHDGGGGGGGQGGGLSKEEKAGLKGRRMYLALLEKYLASPSHAVALAAATHLVSGATGHLDRQQHGIVAASSLSSQKAAPDEGTATLAVGAGGNSDSSNNGNSSNGSSSNGSEQPSLASFYVIVCNLSGSPLSPAAEHALGLSSLRRLPKAPSSAGAPPEPGTWFESKSVPGPRQLFSAAAASSSPSPHGKKRKGAGGGAGAGTGAGGEGGGCWPKVVVLVLAPPPLTRAQRELLADSDKEQQQATLLLSEDAKKVNTDAGADAGEAATAAAGGQPGQQRPSTKEQLAAVKAAGRAARESVDPLGRERSMWVNWVGGGGGSGSSDQGKSSTPLSGAAVANVAAEEKKSPSAPSALGCEWKKRNPGVAVVFDPMTLGALRYRSELTAAIAAATTALSSSSSSSSSSSPASSASASQASSSSTTTVVNGGGGFGGGDDDKEEGGGSGADTKRHSQQQQQQQQQAIVVVVAVLALPPGGGKSTVMSALKTRALNGRGAKVVSSDECAKANKNFDVLLKQTIKQQAAAMMPMPKKQQQHGDSGGDDEEKVRVVGYDKNVPQASGLAKMLKVLRSVVSNLRKQHQQQGGVEVRVALVVPEELDREACWRRVARRDSTYLLNNVPGCMQFEGQCKKVFDDFFAGASKWLPTAQRLDPQRNRPLVTGAFFESDDEDEDDGASSLVKSDNAAGQSQSQGQSSVGGSCGGGGSRGGSRGGSGSGGARSCARVVEELVGTAKKALARSIPFEELVTLAALAEEQGQGGGGLEGGDWSGGAAAGGGGGSRAFSWCAAEVSGTNLHLTLVPPPHSHTSQSQGDGGAGAKEEEEERRGVLTRLRLKHGHAVTVTATRYHVAERKALGDQHGGEAAAAAAAAGDGAGGGRRKDPRQSFGSKRVGFWEVDSVAGLEEDEEFAPQRRCYHITDVGALGSNTKPAAAFEVMDECVVPHFRMNHVGSPVVGGGRKGRGRGRKSAESSPVSEAASVADADAPVAVVRHENNWTVTTYRTSRPLVLEATISMRG